MKKMILLGLVVCFNLASVAQVGIGNTDPKASLDISASSVSSPQNTDGILIPRLDEFPAADPTIDQDGMLVFITGNGTPEKGFYYWDNTTAQWVVMNGVQADNGLMLNNATVELGGTLNQPTEIEQGNFSLTLNSAGAGEVFINQEGIGDTALNISKTDNANGLLYGINLSKESNGSSSLDYGIFTLLEGTSNGAQHALFNVLSTAGDGEKYGLYNVFSTGSQGAKTGVLNSYNSNQGEQFGVDNLFGGNTNNAVVGVSNALSHDGLGPKTGTSNSFSGASGGIAPYTGMENTFSDNGGGLRYGSNTLMEGTGDGDHYGVNAILRGAGTGDKYGIYTRIEPMAGGTHYGSYHEVDGNLGWAGFFVGKNYIADRLSIGELDNENASLNISLNSSPTLYHIELEETIASDGARLRFSNEAESSNDWVLYGQADNLNENSVFSLIYDNTFNIIQVWGDRKVEIDGQLGINVDNPTSYALELPNNALLSEVGQAISAGWITYSDSRVKTAQHDLESGLQKVMSLRPKRYRHHASSFENGQLQVDPDHAVPSMGFIAQELYEVLPEVVFKPENENSELWSVDYDKLIPVTVKAIQELNDKVEDLEDENRQLRTILSKMEAMEARLEKLEGNRSLNAEVGSSR